MSLDHGRSKGAGDRGVVALFLSVFGDVNGEFQAEEPLDAWGVWFNRMLIKANCMKTEREGPKCQIDFL